MKRKLVFKYLFRSFWFSPWATKVPNAAVCTVSPFQLLPFPGGQWSFFPDTLWKGWVKRSCGWWQQKLPQEVWDEWQTGWWEGLGGGPYRPAPGDFEVWKARGRQPGKTQIHSPSNGLFSCISETHSLAGPTAIVFFCCLWGWGWKPRKFGAKMQSRGTGGKKPSSSWSLLFRYLQASFFFF